MIFYCFYLFLRCLTHCAWSPLHLQLEAWKRAMNKAFQRLIFTTKGTRGDPRCWEWATHATHQEVQGEKQVYGCLWYYTVNIVNLGYVSIIVYINMLTYLLEGIVLFLKYFFACACTGYWDTVCLEALGRKSNNLGHFEAAWRTSQKRRMAERIIKWMLGAAGTMSK